MRKMRKMRKVEQGVHSAAEHLAALHDGSAAGNSFNDS
jgi:hypothetical protein